MIITIMVNTFMSGSDNTPYISKLILDLASSSHDVRETAAIDLVEIGEEVIRTLSTPSKIRIGVFVNMPLGD